MKYGIIDVGSNSIRLLISENSKSLRKYVKTTQIAQGLATLGVLSEKPMEESALAIHKLYQTAKAQGADEIYVFATESVRSAANGADFVKAVKQKYNIDIDVLSGQDEALIGFYGAYTGGKCCVIDTGGASTEIIVGDKKGITYSKSMPIGAVSVKDLCGENKDNLNAYINAFLTGYGEIKGFDKVIMIGGTAQTAVAMLEKQEKYLPEKVNGYQLTKDQLEGLFDYVYPMPIKERYGIPGLPEKKVNVICSGILILTNIMKYLGRNVVTVSEYDNLEGYLKVKIEKSVTPSFNIN